jgi:4-amino-4-deoxychorismate lyase
MSRLVESIKLLDGKFLNLYYHEQRMIHSLKALFGHNELIDLQKYLGPKPFPRKGLYKCRIVYDHQSMETVFQAYEARTIRTLKAVEDDLVQYDFKFTDRSGIDRLFARRAQCGDVLIVRDGQVTDSSFANIVFRQGDEWYTPVTYLLNGTTRQRLLAEGKIKAREILKKDIRSFQTFKLVNAMLEFESPEIEVSNIVF